LIATPCRFGRGVSTNQTLGAAAMVLKPQLLAVALELIGLSQGLECEEQHAFTCELALQLLL
jgi:hypothetical protein